MPVLRGDGCSSRRCWQLAGWGNAEIEQGMIIGWKNSIVMLKITPRQFDAVRDGKKCFTGVSQ
jgi:hypothetical protein